jgi:hypothetical protein
MNKPHTIAIRIQRIRRSVHVFTEPLHDERTAEELKARLTEEAGWFHHAYAVSRLCATADQARELYESIRAGFRDARPVRAQ